MKPIKATLLVHTPQNTIMIIQSRIPQGMSPKDRLWDHLIALNLIEDTHLAKALSEYTLVGVLKGLTTWLEFEEETLSSWVVKELINET